jgi:hypothetical protein
MSVYRPKGSPFYHYDFQWRGHRFHGSTKVTSKRDAQKVEVDEREKSKQHVAKMEAARTSLRLDDVAGRYWIEVGQHHKRSDNTGHMVGLLIDFYGKGQGYHRHQRRRHHQIGSVAARAPRQDRSRGFTLHR